MTRSEKELFAAFNKRVLQRAGESFFDKDVALAFLSACDHEGFSVLGLEGFWISPDETIPDPNWIADYSATSASGERQMSETTAMARKLIQNAPDGMLFSFVIEAPSREESRQG